MFNKSSDVMIPLVVSRPIEPQMNWKRVMFSFRGRINRSTFWSYIGLSSLLYLVLALILMLPDLITEASEPNSMYLIVMCPITAIKFFYIDHAVLVKRLHDIDMSAWNLIILYIPIMGIFFGIVVVSRKGNLEPNKYGEPTTGA